MRGPRGCIGGPLPLFSARAVMPQKARREGQTHDPQPAPPGSMNRLRPLRGSVDPSRCRRALRMTRAQRDARGEGTDLSQEPARVSAFGGPVATPPHVSMHEISSVGTRLRRFFPGDRMSPAPCEATTTGARFECARVGLPSSSVLTPLPRSGAHAPNPPVSTDLIA